MRGLRVALSVFSIVTGWAATIIDTGPTGAQVAMKSGFRADVPGSQFAAADDFVLVPRLKSRAALSRNHR